MKTKRMKRTTAMIKNTKMMKMMMIFLMILGKIFPAFFIQILDRLAEILALVNDRASTMTPQTMMILKFSNYNFIKNLYFFVVEQEDHPKSAKSSKEERIKG